MKLILLFFSLLLCSLLSLAQSRPGVLDSTFGINGVVKDSFQSANTNRNYIASILPKGDGHFYVAGDSMKNSLYTLAIKRYLNNGTIDSTFGINGLIGYKFEDTSPICKSAIMQPDGKILMAGSSAIFHISTVTTFNFLCVRIMPDGTIDSTFGINGKVEIAPTKSSGIQTYYGEKIAILKDGKILIAGIAIDPSVEYLLAIRLNGDGSLDSTFATNGILTKRFYSPTTNEFGLYDIKILQNGNICLLGKTSQLLISQIKPNGVIDSTFGNNGIFSDDLGDPIDLIEQSDKKIVLVTIYRDTSDISASFAGEYYLTRIKENGSYDTTWGYNGIISTHLHGNADGQLALDNNGKILLAGTSTDPVPSCYTCNIGYRISCFNLNGSIDTTFGLHGQNIVFVGNFPLANSLKALAIDTFSHSILLGGINSEHEINLLKFNLGKSLNVSAIYKSTLTTISFFPNPTKGTGRLYLSLNHSCSPYISLSDITGKLVEVISAGKLMPQGNNEFNINMSNLLPGNYYLSIFNEGETKTIKIIKN